ncbi:hypothetical protein [Georgenia wangjunii]|uniref:hypothetical protein n=1 Tax=Georgenia wangjunii TaxID=3117730 RepID=UPI002F267476
MHPAAKKWATIGVSMLVVGGLLLAFGPDVYYWAANVAGANAEPGLWVLSVLLNVTREAFMPLGAALVGAAVVIQALAPSPGRTGAGAGHVAAETHETP